MWREPREPTSRTRRRTSPALRRRQQLEEYVVMREAIASTHLVHAQIEFAAVVAVRRAGVRGRRCARERGAAGACHSPSIRYRRRSRPVGVGQRIRRAAAWAAPVLPAVVRPGGASAAPRAPASEVSRGVQWAAETHAHVLDADYLELQHNRKSQASRQT